MSRQEEYKEYCLRVLHSCNTLEHVTHFMRWIRKNKLLSQETQHSIMEDMYKKLKELNYQYYKEIEDKINAIKRK